MSLKATLARIRKGFRQVADLVIVEFSLINMTNDIVPFSRVSLDDPNLCDKCFGKIVREYRYIQVDEKKLVKARKDFYDHAEFHAPTVDRLIFISMKRPFHRGIRVKVFFSQFSTNSRSVLYILLDVLPS